MDDRELQIERQEGIGVEVIEESASRSNAQFGILHAVRFVLWPRGHHVNQMTRSTHNEEKNAVDKGPTNALSDTDFYRDILDIRIPD